MESLGGVFVSVAVVLIIAVLVCAVLSRAYFSSIRKRTCPEKSETVVGFFHPHCFGGGGGERVLWKSVEALGDLLDAGIKTKVVIYTIDRERDSYEKGKRTMRARFQAIVAFNLSMLTLFYLHA